MFENTDSPDNYLVKPENRAEISAAGEAMVSRQLQEVKAMVFMAKQFPRDLNASYQRIMEACSRKSVAEQAEYEYPRGSERVSGPSIRLAEVMAQNWGNIDFGIIELEQRNGESTAMAYAWDLETNVRQAKTFVVPHKRYSRQKGMTQLTDPRDVYEMVANQGARRLRACILGVIPQDIVEKAVQKCNITLQGNSEEPLIDRINPVLAAFKANFGVSIDQIEKSFGYKIEAFTERDLLKLKKIGLSIRDGMAKREDYFEFAPVSKPLDEKTAAVDAAFYGDGNEPQQE
jgi:hypothetical protein